MKLSEKLNELIVRPNQWKFHDELIENAQELEAMTQWQPIDTFVKTYNKPFLLLVKNQAVTGCLKKYHNDEDFWDVYGDIYGDLKPTHFMPIPKPPQSDE